ncbi:hypothetical protein A3C91_03530 [Candidatus Azambacteria bacterium RIFCSPHIGHO2_02_FULL_52_12]|uniref:Uncharacterized protein n=1 Tax=Candidatus Azambacteria bacterium RIFCSPLOWO2_01_FULL_46_25 TaxID=1797298 RepID=A0A1F5BVY9_9BACT|nr:MAG: hypothetical protein A3C91_03530 [Candidatus Azambacteria bacterium RIFCSPHIGHO2_02_FULL_52_12]OGD34774.1 MAG: hypothetical protein A2988_04760 [Candidatus Azambacteria bacterium RIFCSPLOWO2_01_FULL_46_25]OGD36457.1 MAG: hypothetical protein A2850_00755 [Candidatus Azambacteria bacterium RIFCSPHIGHO2_01_FULL_51_74]
MEKQKMHARRDDEAEELVSEEGSRWGMVKSIVTVLIVVGVLSSWWYGFGKSVASVKSAAISVKSGIASALTFGKSATIVDEELSTTGSDSIAMNEEIVTDSSWQIRKPEQGDSIWNVYKAGIGADAGVSFQAQTVNGLKNITVLKNSIPQTSLADNSLSQNKEYTFVSQEAQARYAGKVAEANKKLQSGTHLQDLDTTLRLAYLVANAPSYEFLNSLPSQDIQNLLE